MTGTIERTAAIEGATGELRAACEMGLGENETTLLQVIKAAG
jgi:hypothetical protein